MCITELFFEEESNVGEVNIVLFVYTDAAVFAVQLCAEITDDFLAPNTYAHKRRERVLRDRLFTLFSSLPGRCRNSSYNL